GTRTEWSRSSWHPHFTVGKFGMDREKPTGFLAGENGVKQGRCQNQKMASSFSFSECNSLFQRYLRFQENARSEKARGKALDGDRGRVRAVSAARSWRARPAFTARQSLQTVFLGAFDDRVASHIQPLGDFRLIAVQPVQGEGEQLALQPIVKERPEFR